MWVPGRRFQWGKQGEKQRDSIWRVRIERSLHAPPARKAAMKVSILGAGGVAFGTAAVLARAGHDPMLWSPSGKGTEPFEAGAPLVAQGAIALEFLTRVAKDCAHAADVAEALLFCLPGFCHKTTLDAVAPHIRDGQTVIISS